jgi:hypothetical protein
MLDIEALKVTCWLEPTQVGFNASAHLDMCIDIPYLETATAAISSFPEVTWLAEVLGECNLMADVICLDIGNLDDLVSRRMGDIPGMRNIEVNLYSRICETNMTVPNLALLQETMSSR